MNRRAIVRTVLPSTLVAGLAAIVALPALAAPGAKPAPSPSPTASPAPAGLVGLTSVTYTLPMENPGRYNLVVPCPEGKVALSGGYRYARDGISESWAKAPLESHPDSVDGEAPTKWDFVVENGSVQDPVTITVYVLCATQG